MDPSSVFNFISQNIHIAGWISLIIFVAKFSWKASTFFEGVYKSVEKTTRMENTIESVAHNHLPHLQESINEVNINLALLKTELILELKGVRSDLFQVALRDKHDSIHPAS